MKTMFALFLIVAALTVSAQTNSVHNWTLKSGAVVPGDYYTSGKLMVVIKSHGTNCLLKISDLSTNDWLYFQECKAAQQQRQRQHQLVDSEFQKDFTIAFDKFRGYYTIVNNKALEKKGLPFSIESFPTDLNSKPDHVTLHYSRAEYDWTLFPKTDFIMLFDGKKKAFDGLKVSGDVLSGYASDPDCLEQFDVDFTFDEFKQIAFAKSVEASAGIWDFIFDYQSRRDWQLFVNHFENLNAEK